MANQIRISPAEMRNRATQYSQEAEAVKGVISNMDRLLTDLQAEWEGSASEAYATRYAELKPGFQEAEQLIRDIAKALNTIADTMENADNDIAGQLRG